MCFSLGLSFLDLIDYFLSHVGEVFNYNLFKNFLSAFFFSSSSGTPITWKFVLLILSQRYLMLSSILFILFPLFGSSAVICTILSYSSLLCSSASVILLLVPSRVFLISVIVLFISLYLFFISFMSLLVVLTVFSVACIFSILFSSLHSIFTIIIMNCFSGWLLISSLFIWSCEFLPCSFICAVFLFSSFFFSLACPLDVSFSQALGLYSSFLLVFSLGGNGWLSGLCWFLVRGDLCLCSSGRRSSRSHR